MHRRQGINRSKRPSGKIPPQGSEGAVPLPQRLRESATGLFKDSFKPLSAGAVTGVSASFKPGSSSSSTSTDEASLSFLSSSQYEQASPGQSESFRSTDNRGKLGGTSGQVAFDEFLRLPNEAEQEPDSADWPALNGEQQRRVSVGATENYLTKVQECETRQMQDKNQNLTDRDNDGAAVVALLSDPAFSVDQEPSSILDTESDGAEERTYGQLHTGKEPTKSIDTPHSSYRHELVPDFAAPWSLSHEFPATAKGVYGKAYSQESRSWEIQPWIGILNRYHDEVWGEMLPLVQEAREELEGANEKQLGLEDGGAVRRLKMILQHIGNCNS